jgi:succinoglycan biosynthesis protein ExoA
MLTVSIIVPCYNEQSTIRFLLDAIYAQTYPRSALEVIVSDGLSEDNTRAEITKFQDEHPDFHLQLVDNPIRSIPAGLNRAIQAATSEIIIRLDAHSQPYPDYIERCVLALESGLGENVGGIWEIQPGKSGWMAESIAIAAAHPLGVGDALYRHASHQASVDTVPFGAFKSTLIDKIGMFDETLLTNEDYEFNTRIRQSGGRVWLDPGIRSVYFARTTLTDLAQQYWRYGFWKWRMLRRNPRTLRWRQALPPLFVLSLLAGVLSAPFSAYMRYFISVEIMIYLLVLFVASLQTLMHKHKGFLLVGLPLAIATMHIAWGAGFLWSIIISSLRSQKYG